MRIKVEWQNIPAEQVPLQVWHFLIYLLAELLQDDFLPVKYVNRIKIQITYCFIPQTTQALLNWQHPPAPKNRHKNTKKKISIPQEPTKQTYKWTSLNQLRTSIEPLTQQRIISQITSMGASDLSPSGQTWVPDIRYPALITAERKIIADGEVHLRVEQRLCRLKNRGTSGNSCKE